MVHQNQQDTKSQLAVIEAEKIELRERGREIKTLLPGGSKLSDNQAIALAKYSGIRRADVFRGEVYGFQDRNGNLVLVDGYKLLVRYAKKISDYSDKYEPLADGEEGIGKGDIGYRCYIMRHDNKSELSFYIQAGATFTEAYNLVATQAVGIVTASEQKISPPKGWSWDQVGRKRALKNALNLAYPMPSIDELMNDYWQVGNTETIEADWSESESYRTTGEKERAAQLNAWNRQNQEHWSEMTEAEQAAKVETNVDVMRGTNGDDDDPLELSPDEEESSPPPPKPKRPVDVSTKFWLLAKDAGIDRKAGMALIGEHGGDIDAAYEALQKMPMPEKMATDAIQTSLIEDSPQQPNNYQND